MRKTLFLCVIGLAIANVMVFLPSCEKEQVIPATPVDQHFSTEEIPDNMVVTEEDVSDRTAQITCNGTLTVTKLNCNGCGNSDMKVVVEVLQRCLTTDPWTVTQTIPCSAINGGTFPISICHERKLGFRMSFKGTACSNHANFNLQANITIRNALNATVLAATGQNGANTWDIFASTGVNNVLCPGIPEADSCL